MKISIITVAFNSRPYIEECINSVLRQTYSDIEYLVIDGGSTDGTVDLLRQYDGSISRWVTEPDKGIYDAMNKGIKLSTGDVIGFLNSDDLYVGDAAISSVAKEFQEKSTDSVFADLLFVKRNDTRKVVRYYTSFNFSPRKFAYGWMPAHSTFFAKRGVYEKYGIFKTDYRIAADYELLLRFLGRYGITYSYLPEVLVKMRTGGVSTRNFRSNVILNREIMRACAENGINTNILKVYSKYLTKVLQLLKRPRTPV